jgi:hypothetical protein
LSRVGKRFSKEGFRLDTIGLLLECKGNRSVRGGRMGVCQ